MRPKTNNPTVTIAYAAMMTHAFHAERQRRSDTTTTPTTTCATMRNAHQAEAEPGTSASVKPVHGAPK